MRGSKVVSNGQAGVITPTPAAYGRVGRIAFAAMGAAEHGSGIERLAELIGAADARS
jgi:hypothetical protein